MGVAGRFSISHFDTSFNYNDFLALQLSRCLDLHVISGSKSKRCARCRNSCFEDLKGYIYCEDSNYKFHRFSAIRLQSAKNSNCELHADLVTVLCNSNLFKPQKKSTMPDELHLCRVKVFEFFVAICQAQ